MTTEPRVGDTVTLKGIDFVVTKIRRHRFMGYHIALEEAATTRTTEGAPE